MEFACIHAYPRMFTPSALLPTIIQSPFLKCPARTSSSSCSLVSRWESTLVGFHLATPERNRHVSIAWPLALDQNRHLKLYEAVDLGNPEIYNQGTDHCFSGLADAREILHQFREALEASRGALGAKHP